MWREKTNPKWRIWAGLEYLPILCNLNYNFCILLMVKTKASKGGKCSLSINGSVRACRCSVAETLDKGSYLSLYIRRVETSECVFFSSVDWLFGRSFETWIDYIHMILCFGFKQCLEGIILFMLDVIEDPVTKNSCQPRSAIKCLFFHA